MNSGRNQLDAPAHGVAWRYSDRRSAWEWLRAPNLARLRVEAPRWLLLGALVFAPWAYGSTGDWAIQCLGVWLWSIGVLWAADCAARRHWPRVPLLPAVFAGAILLHGWWMALNAHHRFDPDLPGLVEIKPWISSSPGSADGPLSISTMLTLTGMIVALLLSCELAQRPVWRKRLWLTIALAGFSIALFGVVQKLGGDRVLAWTWEPEKRDVANNFALFRYRGNAGAWLNVTWPLLAGLAFVNFQKPIRPWVKVFWLAALVIVAAGVQLNPSRASWGIALVLSLFLGGRIAWHFWKRRAEAVPLRELLLCGMIVASILTAVASIVFLGGWETGWRRLGTQGFDLATRSPAEIYLRMIPDAGLMGYGPGTFQTVFPPYQTTHDFSGRPFPEFWVTRRWIHAHQDYLQTLIEWGYLGAAFWALLIFGGLVAGVTKYFRLRSEFSLRWLLLGSVLALAGVLIHAGIDFPLQVASIQLYVAVLLGICWGASARRGR